MPNAATAKPKSRRRPTAAAKKRKYPWLGYAEGMARVRPRVDLTKPTLPPGKYFT
jgi:hypothetical protein